MRPNTTGLFNLGLAKSKYGRKLAATDASTPRRIKGARARKSGLEPAFIINFSCKTKFRF